MAMLEVRDLDVSFDGVAAVDGVSLSVDKGEVVAVLGPSGSGKSTLLRSIAGLQDPDRGTVAVDQVDVTRAAPHRRGVGLMFQAPTLFPHRDVAGNVGFGLRMAKTTPLVTQARVGELLELVGLPGYESRRVDTLSGGQAQRVALARTLAPEPNLLLLDEPFGALDAELRARLVADVGRLVRGLGLTVVAVTHDRAEAYALADRVLVMREGRIVADGTPERLWAGPPSAWVATFIGMPNVLPASIAGSVATTAWGDLPVIPMATGTHVVVPTGSVVLEAGTHVAVPSSAVARDEEAPTSRSAGVRTGAVGVPAVVASRAFAGESVRLTLRALDGPGELVAEVPVAAAPPVDATVFVSIDPTGVIVLP